MPFTDTTGQQWNVAVTCATAKRLWSLLKLDLGDVPKVFAILGGPQAELVDFLYAVVKPQADASGITDEQFAERLDGDVLTAAIEAFQEAFTDFCPSRQRTIWNELLTVAARVADRTMTATENEVKAAIGDGTIERLMEKALTSSVPSTASEAPSASAPTP